MKPIECASVTGSGSHLVGVVYLIGHPVAHSLSPAMHNAAFGALSLPHRYETLDVPPDELAGAVERLRGEGVLGANVTVPHKESVPGLVQSLDAEAIRTGAVNTISRLDPSDPPATGQSPVLKGWNTDRRGFERSLAEAGIVVAARSALVLGAGGAARAVVLALADGMARVAIANRTAQRAEAISAAYDQLGESQRPRVVNWPEGRLSGYDLVVNATSLGLHGEDPLEGVTLEEGTVIVDIVPTTEETPLLLRARAAGCTVVDGLSMLLHQAALAFTIWTDREAPLEVMRAALPRRI